MTRRAPVEFDPTTKILRKQGKRQYAEKFQNLFNFENVDPLLW
jgi:hypothetical protein